MERLENDKELRLKLWLSMPMGERLHQALLHMTDMDSFWKSDKAKELLKNYMQNEDNSQAPELS